MHNNDENGQRQDNPINGFFNRRLEAFIMGAAALGCKFWQSTQNHRSSFIISYVNGCERGAQLANRAKELTVAGSSPYLPPQPYPAILRKIPSIFSTTFNLFLLDNVFRQAELYGYTGNNYHRNMAFLFIALMIPGDLFLTWLSDTYIKSDGFNHGFYDCFNNQTPQYSNIGQASHAPLNYLPQIVVIFGIASLMFWYGISNGIKIRDLHELRFRQINAVQPDENVQAINRGPGL